MPNRALIDISRLPEDLQAQVLHVIDHHNDLTGHVGTLKEDVDKISGTTPEQKREMHGLFGLMSTSIHWLHGKRFNFLGAGLFVWVIISVMEKLGIPTKELTPVIEKLVHVFLGV